MSDTTATSSKDLSFTASNGVTIKRDGDTNGALLFSAGSELLKSFYPREMYALREFFRAADDERLGRWRWPEKPDFVVYRHGKSYVRVLLESDGMSHDFTLDEIEAYRSAPSGRMRAAIAYFDAHPERERKPWHDAQPDDIWILTIDGAELPGHIDDDRDFLHLSQNRYFSIFDESITAGRRIWPEVTA